MEKNKKTIQEIKELVNSYGVENVSKLLGKTTRAVQYWLEDDPKTPSITTQRKIHELHVKHIEGNDLLATMPNTDDSYKDRFIAALERENSRLQKDLNLSLSELRYNILKVRAMAETNQNLLIEILAKQRKTSLSEVAEDANKLFDEYYKSMKEEGNFPDAGK